MFAHTQPLDYVESTVAQFGQFEERQSPKSPRIEASVLVSGYVMFDWLPLLVEKVASKSTLLGY